MGLFGKKKAEQKEDIQEPKPEIIDDRGEKDEYRPRIRVRDGEEEPQPPKRQKHTLLLHACCGPCATYPLEKIAEDFDVKVLFYNPNITDIHEYNLRRQNLDYFLKNRKNTYPWDDEIKMFEEVYDPHRFYELVRGFENQPEGGERCQICIAFRMEATAIVAEEYKFDYFGTTLSVSPHKNSAWIREIGTALEEKYNVKYLDENFKKNNGYARSREISIEYRLYRQDYCGCQFSKRDMIEKQKVQEREEREEKDRLSMENKMKDDDISHTGDEMEVT